MRIVVEIKDTTPTANEGVYVYDSGPIEGNGAYAMLRSLDRWILQSLAELNKLKVTG
jgi:hypothetical protein